MNKNATVLDTTILLEEYLIYARLYSYIQVND
jgi:hypothetical protein